MTALLVLAGVAILLVVAVDMVSTTLVTTRRAGPLTGSLAHALWRLARRVATGPRSVVVLWSGPAVLLLTVGTWLLGLWLGWTLIFSASPGAVVAP